jgi:glyoxylase-like metal-dependent hydrolase (beta-lactamase superfamily II)
MTRTLVLTGIAIGGCTLGVLAQGPAPSPEAVEAMKVEKVADRLYVITGADPSGAFAGGNTAVFIAAEGVTLVDTKLAGFGPALLERVRSLTDKPVTRLINTHAHADHTGGNVFFAATAETIVSDRTDAALLNARNKAPRRTYKDRLTVGSGPDRIDLYYFGRGHTDGDTFVVFTALRTMHAGDMFAWKSLPYIDANIGGSVLEHPKTLAAAARTVPNVTTVIPGHHPVVAWSDFVEYAQFSADFVAFAERSMQAGKTVDQASAEYRVPDRFAGYTASAADNLPVSTNMTLAYDELRAR